MVTQLVHVGVVLGHDRDGVALLANDEASLLLCGVPQVYAIILRGRRESYILVGMIYNHTTLH